MSLFSKKETRTLEVGGMHCGKCVEHVTEALRGVAGVTDAKVVLEPGSATVTGHGLDDAALIAAVESVGFTAKVAE